MWWATFALGRFFDARTVQTVVSIAVVADTVHNSYVLYHLWQERKLEEAMEDRALLLRRIGTMLDSIHQACAKGPLSAMGGEVECESLDNSCHHCSGAILSGGHGHMVTYRQVKGWVQHRDCESSGLEEMEAAKGGAEEHRRDEERGRHLNHSVCGTPSHAMGERSMADEHSLTAVLGGLFSPELPVVTGQGKVCGQPEAAGMSCADGGALEGARSVQPGNGPGANLPASRLLAAIRHRCSLASKRASGWLASLLQMAADDVSSRLLRALDSSGAGLLLSSVHVRRRSALRFDVQVDHSFSMHAHLLLQRVQQQLFPGLAPEPLEVNLNEF